MPAGLYTALPVDAVPAAKRAGIPVTKVTSWYAPGVGLVLRMTGDSERVPTAFTPGK